MANKEALLLHISNVETNNCMFTRAIQNLAIIDPFDTYANIKALDICNGCDGLLHEFIRIPIVRLLEVVLLQQLQI